jgi:polar amino acid transport system ATP-binding protein
MAMEPSLLLLDEPTSALDPESRADVLDSLYEIARSGKSMILVTHEIDFALEVADRMAFMEGGRIIAIGDTESVISNERLRRFLRSIRI